MPITNVRILFRNETGEDLQVSVERPLNGTAIVVIRKRQAKTDAGIIMPTGMVVENPLGDKLKDS